MCLESLYDLIGLNKEYEYEHKEIVTSDYKGFLTNTTVVRHLGF
jgi:hypothetical protein